MKKILVCLMFLLCLSARAQTIVTATVTVTNVAGTTNGNTIVINGATRTFTNSVTSSGTQVLLFTNIAGATSNLFLSLTSVRPPNANVSTNSTNAIIIQSFPGTPMVVTAGGIGGSNWATVTFSTNTLTDATVMRSPMSAVGNVERTNTATGIVDYLNSDTSTSTVSATAKAMSNYMTLSTAQLVTGANTFSNASQFITGGGISNVAITNFTRLIGSNGVVWALILVNPNLTNGQNFGNAFRSPGTGTGSEQFGLGSQASGVGTSAFGQNAVAGADSATAFGATATATGVASSAFGLSSSAFGLNSTALGILSFANFDNSTAVGQQATSTAANQVRLGTASENVSIPGGLQVDGVISNATVAGSLTLQNELLTNRKNLTGLANGANSVATSTNTYLKVSGPSGAFSINGLSGGVDGRHLIIQNSTSFTMTIANDSGTEPTAANRILTGTGADVSEANNPGCVTLIYDSAASRWILLSKN